MKRERNSLDFYIYSPLLGSFPKGVLQSDWPQGKTQNSVTQWLSDVYQNGEDFQMVLISVCKHFITSKERFPLIRFKGQPKTHSGSHSLPTSLETPTTTGWPRLASPGSGFEIIRHSPLRSVCNDWRPNLNFDDKNAFGGRRMVRVQLARSWLDIFEASEQMTRDDQVLMHKGCVGGRLKLL